MHAGALCGCRELSDSCWWSKSSFLGSESRALLEGRFNKGPSKAAWGAHPKSKLVKTRYGAGENTLQ
jgi:hypothetical protein